MKDLFDRKENKLFIILTSLFIVNTIVAECIGVKIFALEDTLGIAPFNWNLFGQEGSLNFTAGVLIWPVVFLMTDIINEYFGKKKVQFLSFLAVGLIIYAFIIINFAIGLKAPQWWIESSVENGVSDMQRAFANVYGQSLWIIAGSLVAFFVGQIVDVSVFQQLKVWTKEKKLWLRATGSTLVSQFIDSFVVLYIAFVLGPQQWDYNLFLAVGTVNYIYKFFVAVLLTPVIYIIHYAIDAYLGEPLATDLKRKALE